MKYFFAALFTTFALTAQAQTTAMDWTRTSCHGTEHNLHSELDSGYVVVLELIMLDCSPCVTAAKGINSIVEEYAQSHPGKVRSYAIGFDNSYTCPQMLSWKTGAGINAKVFTGGAEETTYYGGMGMPTIVVTGGSTHTVFYKKKGFAPSDATNIRSAIDNALLTSSITNTKNNLPQLQLYPNPAQNYLHYSAEGLQVQKIVLTDISGRVISTYIPVEKNASGIDISGLSAGMYLAHFTTVNGQVAARTFVKN